MGGIGQPAQSNLMSNAHQSVNGLAHSGAFVLLAGTFQNREANGEFISGSINDCFRPLGIEFTIDFVNFAGAKGKMFVMRKHANLSHELTYLLRPHSWLLFAQKSLPNSKPK